MSKKRGITNVFFIVLMAGLLLVLGCGQPDHPSGPRPGGPPEVAVVAVQPIPLTLTTELPGRTSPCLVAEVRPQVGGIILSRDFVEGSDVAAGQVLYQIDPAMFQAAFNSAKAALAKSEANLVPARLKATRLQKLVGTGSVSQQDYDDAAAAQGQAMAEVAASRAALETARLNLAYTKVTAPISGRIGKSSVTTGALVTANQPTALATIQQLDPIFVDVTRSSAEMLRLKRDLASGTIKGAGAGGARVGLVLEDGSPYSLPGTLKFSDITVDQATGSVTLRTIFPNPDQLLLPGMYVRATIEEGINEQAILVPQQAVSRDPSGRATTLIAGAEDKVEPRIIKVDRSVGDKWLVTEGLKPGDRVIVEGAQRTQPGMRIKVVNWDGPTTPKPTGPTAHPTPASQATHHRVAGR